MQPEDPAEEAFFDESNETAVDDPADDAKQKFKIDVYNVVLDTIVTELKTRFNDTTVGVLKALQCISPVRFLDKHEDVSVISPAKSSLDQLKTLCQFYSEDLSSNEMVFLEYKNVHALLNAWKFEDGDAVPRDHEDLLIFFQDHNLTAQFENIVSLLKLALTLPVSSAHDERACSCLKRVKT